MMYLGKNPIGLLTILAEWAVTKFKIEFNQYQSFDTATLFFNDTNVNNVISQLPNGKYKILFKNNTTNTRAGEWIIFIKNGTTMSGIEVMRVGLASPQGSTYGVNVYEGAEGCIYQSIRT